MQKSKHKSGNPLMQALNFNEDDLAANREGRLSKAQRNLLYSHQNVQNTWILLSFLTGCPLMLVLLLAASRLGALILVPVMVIGLAVATWFFLSQRQRFARDLADAVHVLEGPVQLDVISESTYIVAIGDQELSVKKAAFLAFKNGDPYRIYYAPHSKTVLSVEWMYDEHFI